MNQLAQQPESNASLNDRVRLFGTVAGGEFIIDERNMYIHPLPITSGAEDRSGEKIDPNGIITASYEQNPVVFFAHSHKFMPLVPPVGQAINPDGQFDCFREGDIWKSGCLFSQATRFAGQLFALVAEGTIRGRSIGATAHGFAPYKPTLPGMVFHQGEIRPTKTRSVVCTKAELFEWSWTPLPQNRDMVIALKSMMSHGRVDGQTLDPVLGEILKSMDLFEPIQSHGYGPGFGFTKGNDPNGGRWVTMRGTPVFIDGKGNAAKGPAGLGDVGGKSSGGGSSAKKSHKDHRDDFHGKLNDHSKGRVTAEGDNEVHGSSHVRNVVRAHSELHGMKVTKHEGGETHEDKHGNKIVLSKRGNKHVATFHAAEGKATPAADADAPKASPRPLSEPKESTDATTPADKGARPLNEAHGEGDTNTKRSSRPIAQNAAAAAALEDRIDHHRRRLTRMRSNGLHTEADAEFRKIQDLRRQVTALNTPRAPGEGVRPLKDEESAKPAPAAKQTEAAPKPAEPEAPAPAPVAQQDEHATLAHHERMAAEMRANGRREAAAQHRIQAALARRRIAGEQSMFPAPEQANSDKPAVTGTAVVGATVDALDGAASVVAENESASDNAGKKSTTPSTRAEYLAEPVTPQQALNRRMEPLREASAKIAADTNRLTRNARTRTAEEATLHAAEADDYAFDNKPRAAAESHRRAAAALRTEAAGLDGPAAEKHDRLAERHIAQATALEAGLPQLRSIGLSDATIARNKAAREARAASTSAKPKATTETTKKTSGDAKPAALTKKSNYEPGEKVEFTFRGQRVEGTVLRNREVRRSGRTRDLARRVTGNPDSLNQRAIEISGPNGTYTVGPEAIHGSRGQGDLRAAQDAHSNIRRSRAEQASQNRSTADRKIGHLEIGQEIEVRFRDIGWQKVKYKGIVPGSGNVRYEHRGKSRTTHADAVRDPNGGGEVAKSLDGNSSASFYKGDVGMLDNQMILGVVFDHGTTPAQAAQFLKDSSSFLIETPIKLDPHTMMLKSLQVEYDGEQQQIQDEDFPGVRFIIAKAMDTDEEADAGLEDDEELPEEEEESEPADDRPTVVADPQAPIVKAKPGARWCSAMSSGLAELHKMATAALEDVERPEVIEEAGKSLGILNDLQTVLADLSSKVYPSATNPEVSDEAGGTHGELAEVEGAETGDDAQEPRVKKIPRKPPEKELDAETLKAMFYHDRVFVPSPLVGAINRIAAGEGQDAVDRAREFLTRSLLKGVNSWDVVPEPPEVAAADRVEQARQRLALQRFEASKRRLELQNNS